LRDEATGLGPTSANGDSNFKAGDCPAVSDKGCYVRTAGCRGPGCFDYDRYPLFVLFCGFQS